MATKKLTDDILERINIFSPKIQAVVPECKSFIRLPFQNNILNSKKQYTFTQRSNAIIIYSLFYEVFLKSKKYDSATLLQTVNVKSKYLLELSGLSSSMFYKTIKILTENNLISKKSKDNYYLYIDILHEKQFIKLPVEILKQQISNTSKLIYAKILQVNCKYDHATRKPIIEISKMLYGKSIYHYTLSRVKEMKDLGLLKEVQYKKKNGETT